jgi:hypothetical protein
MKYLKNLSLAAVAAMALLAFVGAGAASATELDKITADGTKHPLAVGEHIHATLEGTSALTTTGGTTLATCTISTVTGAITNAGGATATVVGSVATSGLTWGAKGAGCTNHTTTLKGGELEVHTIANSDNGTVTAKGFEVTIDGIFGVSCVYTAGTGIHLGTLTGTTNATGHAVLHVAGTVTRTTSSSGFCPEKTIWNGTYKVTTPTGLFVTP